MKPTRTGPVPATRGADRRTPASGVRAAAGDHTAAERDLEGLYGYGRAVAGDERTAAAVTRQVGLAVQRAALGELANLHRSAGDQPKLAEVQRRLGELK